MQYKLRYMGIDENNFPLYIISKLDFYPFGKREEYKFHSYIDAYQFYKELTGKHPTLVSI